jgi:hypothetical protein
VHAPCEASASTLSEPSGRPQSRDRACSDAESAPGRHHLPEKE